jgi:hypothetical protein
MTKEPEQIINESKYKGNEIIEEQDKIVESLVNIWNSIITEYENKTVAFALRVKKLLKGYPDKTISELIDKVRKHPNLKSSAHSKDRIMQGIRLVDSPIGQKLLDWNKKPVEEMKATPFEDKPYLKTDGTVFWEYYFVLNKYNFDPGLKYELEQEGKKQLWSVRKLQTEISKIMEERSEPNTVRRNQKRDFIKEIVIMLKELQPQDLSIIRDTIYEQFEDKLIKYKKWKEEKDD